MTEKLESSSQAEPFDFWIDPRFVASRLAEIFARQVLSFLVSRELLSPERAECLLSRRHTGFNKLSII